MARLVFCFFAEDTDIFLDKNLFTAAVRQYSEDRTGLTNSDQVLRQLFLAMATPTQHDGKPDLSYRQDAGVQTRGGSLLGESQPRSGGLVRVAVGIRKGRKVSAAAVCLRPGELMSVFSRSMNWVRSKLESTRFAAAKVQRRRQWL